MTAPDLPAIGYGVAALGNLYGARPDDVWPAIVPAAWDAGIRYFTQKADSVDRSQYGNIASEVLIDLLSRVGRHEAALQEFAKRMPPDARLMGIAPSMLELSQRLGSFDKMRELCADRGDLLGYTAALIQPEKVSV